jgi:very-long-chain enoyl-CoA reductase
METFMIIPQWTTINIILYGYLALMALAVGPLEYFGQAMMAYSKFRPANGLSTRTGMFIIYFFPLLAVIISALPYIANPTAVQLIVFAAVFIHFAKRVLESLFLHKYSGPIGAFTTFMIAGFYSLAAYLIGFLNRQPLQSMDIWFYIGVALFTIGIIGNFTHHKILADLRKNTLDYIIPSSGLFDLIVCPHYLFEIVAWAGIFLVSRHLASLLVLVFIIGYLIARSIRTLNWYKERFSNFPTQRKALIPFIL